MKRPLAQFVLPFGLPPVVMLTNCSYWGDWQCWGSWPYWGPSQEFFNYPVCEWNGNASSTKDLAAWGSLDQTSLDPSTLQAVMPEMLSQEENEEGS